MTRTKLAKIIMTIVLAAGSVSSFMLDWSPNHLLNPLWHPHARFHGALLLFLLETGRVGRVVCIPFGAVQLVIEVLTLSLAPVPQALLVVGHLVVAGWSAFHESTSRQFSHKSHHPAGRFGIPRARALATQRA